ncbi:chromate transporter [Virgibacillus sp. SK37]|uniref:chromate transporter n=1 Tax=Virgibacillus sp. SK37 TaxID=403957 RepID=UPI0004D17DAA|nr:chromate transporter [Virgibacillus sp. SK37]AIF43067.1 transporter [Virgibacillus sp. SK37]
MIYWKIFYANFISNILGYGGGPATIPLLQREVVDEYGWLTNQEFSEIVALGNGLPGPIATKMAAYIGYDQAGILGAIVGLFASVAPSLILLIVLLSILMKYKDAPRVKKLTKIIRPTIAVLLASMTLEFLADSYIDTGILHTLILTGAGYYFLEVRVVSPVYVVLGALIYGALFLS